MTKRLLDQETENEENGKGIEKEAGGIRDELEEGEIKEDKKRMENVRIEDLKIKENKVNDKIDEVLHHYVSFKINTEDKIIILKIDINSYTEDIREIKQILFSSGIPIERWQVNSCNCYFPEDILDFEYLKCAYCDGIRPLKPNHHIDNINEQWQIQVEQKLKKVK